MSGHTAGSLAQLKTIEIVEAWLAMWPGRGDGKYPPAAIGHAEQAVYGKSRDQLMNMILTEQHVRRQANWYFCIWCREGIEQEDGTDIWRLTVAGMDADKARYCEASINHLHDHDARLDPGKGD